MEGTFIENSTYGHTGIVGIGECVMPEDITTAVVQEMKVFYSTETRDQLPRISCQGMIVQLLYNMDERDKGREKEEN
jgi:hypothetical protein